MASANKLTLFIVIFMLAGILSGAAIHEYASADAIKAWSDNITLLTDIFLRLIKMVIAPLVFSTLTVGIMKLGETSTIGRVGGKAMVWFISSSVLSILVGLFIVTLERPGSGLNLAIPKEAVDTGLAVGGMTLKAFLSHTIPTSIAGAMANNEILQIVVFSMFFGIAGAKIQCPAGGRAGCGLPYHAEGDGLRDVRRAAGHFRRHLLSYCHSGSGHSAELRLLYWRLLRGNLSHLHGAAGRRLYGAEERGVPPGQHAERPGAGGVYHQQLRSGLSEDP